mmetsp:Transcript_63078/g.124686  ORF Transcript_63078/g.124686 Transcript_63078/m.124686 type:complete len:317 (-) Transcript_63078:317-1267(-)
MYERFSSRSAKCHRAFVAFSCQKLTLLFSSSTRGGIPPNSMIMIWLTGLSFAKVARAPVATVETFRASAFAKLMGRGACRRLTELRRFSLPSWTVGPSDDDAAVATIDTSGAMAPSSAICAWVSGLSRAISESARAATPGGPSVGSTSHCTKAETAPALAISSAAPARIAICASVLAASSFASPVPSESIITKAPMPFASLIASAFDPIGAKPDSTTVACSCATALNLPPVSEAMSGLMQPACTICSLDAVSTIEESDKSAYSCASVLSSLSPSFSKVTKAAPPPVVELPFCAPPFLVPPLDFSLVAMSRSAPDAR